MLATPHLQKIDKEEKPEWIQRRERLRKIIGSERVDPKPAAKALSVESMLKIQRENFGLTVPILGQYVQKYMQYRPKSNFDPIKIYNGKVLIYIIF